MEPAPDTGTSCVPAAAAGGSLQNSTVQQCYLLNPDGSEELVILRDSLAVQQLERQRKEMEAAAAEPPTFKVSGGGCVLGLGSAPA